MPCLAGEFQQSNAVRVLDQKIAPRLERRAQTMPAMNAVEGCSRPVHRSQLMIATNKQTIISRVRLSLLPTQSERFENVSSLFSFFSPIPVAAVAVRLACSDPTEMNRAQSPVGPFPDFRMWESCRTMPLVRGFSRGSPFSPGPSFRLCSILTSITFIYPQDFAVKNGSNLFTHSPQSPPGCHLIGLLKKFINFCCLHWPMVRLLDSNLGEPGSIPGGAAPGPSHNTVALAFRRYSIPTSLRPHRRSRPRCQEQPKSFHSTPLIGEFEIRKISTAKTCDGGGEVVRLLASHIGEPGSIPGGVAPDLRM
ncbi:hypothetical protein PR048_021863 [Dryococelus australis]|uniref:Uncharacterized protein n=1 Tax=Dryococelus australis TaxID=614101 RepID=A0ABQ9GZF1_9NEOP|nr:hypothetical protein PR048_021863 [Dryococelus australis]